MNGLSLLHHCIQRMLIACDAAGCKPEDLRLEDFSEETRARLKRESDEIIWGFVNGTNGPTADTPARS